jgi:hypothetical protein
LACDSTAFRVVDTVAASSFSARRAPHARARVRFCELGGAPKRLMVDVDATLITAHLEKDQAAGN